MSHSYSFCSLFIIHVFIYLVGQGESSLRVAFGAQTNVRTMNFSFSPNFIISFQKTKCKCYNMLKLCVHGKKKIAIFIIYIYARLGILWHLFLLSGFFQYAN